MFKGDIGLGTQATRAQIIETLLTRHYVVREKKKLSPTDKGCFLIDYLRRFERARVIATPEETARWEMQLDRIAQGIGDAQAFMEAIREFVGEGVKELKMSQGEQKVNQQPLGACPVCGGNVIEGKKGFGCANWREKDGACRFVIWKTIAGRTMDGEMVRTLLSGGVTPVMQFQSREGKEFSATLRLEQQSQDGPWQPRFVFPEQSTTKSPDEKAEAKASDPPILGKCPRCGGDVIEGKKGYGCRNWRSEDGGCRFVIWKEIAGKAIFPDVVNELLEKGETDMIPGFMSRKGKEFSARLKLDEAFKTVFVF
jgi:DNA topoisomerase-3